VARPYIYLTSSIVVRLDAAFPSVIDAMRSAGFDIVDYDEATRRIVVRVPARLAPSLASFIRSYASSFSVEVKASIRRRLSRESLRKLGIVYVAAGARLLFLLPCNGGDGRIVWGEHRGGRTLLKYCRSALYRDPASFPQSLCAFQRDPVELLEEARPCLERAAELLEKPVDVKGE